MSDNESDLSVGSDIEPPSSDEEIEESDDESQTAQDGDESRAVGTTTHKKDSHRVLTSIIRTGDTRELSDTFCATEVAGILAITSEIIDATGTHSVDLDPEFSGMASCNDIAIQQLKDGVSCPISLLRFADTIKTNEGVRKIYELWKVRELVLPSSVYLPDTPLLVSKSG